jgi:class 3 adenylate cyclase
MEPATALSSSGRNPPTGRKLVAIVYADVVGFSRLIGLDAEGTQARLRAIRREPIDPEIRRHEGSVRKLGDVVRVNAQLASTADGVHVWSNRFDESMSELAEGQNLIVNRIGSALSVELIDLESARSLRERPDNPDDPDLILRANSLLNKPPSEQPL